jgi:hypothetical protein
MAPRFNGSIVNFYDFYIGKIFINYYMFLKIGLKWFLFYNNWKLKYYVKHFYYFNLDII